MIWEIPGDYAALVKPDYHCACYTVVNSPLILAGGNDEERDYAFAAQSSTIALFAFAGSLTAGFLPGLYAAWRDLSLDLPAAYRLGLWIAPCLYLLATWVILRARPITLPRTDRSSAASAQRPSAILLFVTLTIFLIAATEGAIRSFFNVKRKIFSHSY